MPFTKFIVFCVLLNYYTLQGNALILLDFCEYCSRLVESNMGREIPILRSRISRDTFGDFMENKTFHEQFEITFRDKIVDDVVDWHTNIDQMFIVAMGKFVPKTLGCIYKQEYTIKALSNRTSIDINTFITAVSTEVYDELKREETNSILPVIVLQGNSIRESVFCIFGTIYATRTYFLVQCLFEPSIGNEIPKFIKVSEKFKPTKTPAAADTRVLCLSYFPKLCKIENVKEVPRIIENRSAGQTNTTTITTSKKEPSEEQNKTPSEVPPQTFNITNALDGWKYLFRHFYCNHCTLNVNIKN